MAHTNRSARKSGPGRKHSKPQERRKDKIFAVKRGIAEPLRRYAKRYGVDVNTVAQTQVQADRLIADRAEHQREVDYDNDEISDARSTRHYPSLEGDAA